MCVFSFPENSPSARLESVVECYEQAGVNRPSQPANFCRLSGIPSDFNFSQLLPLILLCFARPFVSGNVLLELLFVRIVRFLF